jgi:hypothetical protein
LVQGRLHQKSRSCTKSPFYAKLRRRRFAPKVAGNKYSCIIGAEPPSYKSAPTITGRYPLGSRPASFCGKMLRSLLLCAMMCLRAMVLGRLGQVPLHPRACALSCPSSATTGRSNRGGPPHHLRVGFVIARLAFSARMYSRAVALKVGWEFSSVLYPSRRPLSFATPCNLGANFVILRQTAFMVQGLQSQCRLDFRCKAGRE